MRGKIVLKDSNREMEFNGETSYIKENDNGVTLVVSDYAKEGNKNVMQELFFPWTSVREIQKYYTTDSDDEYVGGVRRS